jgi:hypothetical protein
MSEYIFSPNTQASPEQDKVIKYYTVSGKEDFFDEDQMPRTKNEINRTYAKHVISSNARSNYYIKLSLEHKFYNPLAVYGIEKTKSFLDNVVRYDGKFKSVSKKCFDLYLHFLKTKNLSYLYNSEREDY